MRKGFDERYRAEQDANVKMRMAAVRMYKTPKIDGTRNTLEEVAHSLNMSVSWVSKQVQRYDSEGINGLYDRHRSGAPRTINHEVVAEILRGWRTGKLTSKKISQEYYNRTGEKLSRSYARQLARNHGYKAKTPQKLHANAASPSQVRRWQGEHIETVEELVKLGYTAVAEDEASFFLDSPGNVKYYAPPGKAAATVTSEKRGRITVAGLVSDPDENGKSRRCHVFGEKPNSDLFIKVCDKALKVFGLVVMVLDQAGWHLSKAVEEYVEKQGGALILIVQPTSSPFLNAKELDWRQAKMDEFLTIRFHTKDELKATLITILNTRLSRNRNVVQRIKSSPYKNRPRSFVELSTYIVNN